MNDNNTLVTVQNLKKHFPIQQGIVIQRTVGAVKAVDGITFSIARGETLGLVGESGCGKSTAGRTILGLYPATDGEIAIDGLDVRAAKGKTLQQVRRKAQMIFQDPFASLNPRWTVNSIVGEPLRVHKLASNEKARSERVKELMELVGLSSRYVNRFPHEFSGGQRQRIGVARALASEPDFIVCDEPISALDVSIQAQIMNLLTEIRKERKLSYLVISHDLAVVEAVSDRVAVLYFGAVVEVGPAEAIFARPRHPYTRLLAESAPVVGRPLTAPEGRETELPDPLDPPPGCAFAERCPLASDICRAQTPALEGDAAKVACHHPL